MECNLVIRSGELLRSRPWCLSVVWKHGSLKIYRMGFDPPRYHQRLDTEQVSVPGCNPGAIAALWVQVPPNRLECPIKQHSSPKPHTVAA